MSLTELIVKLSVPSDHAASVNEEINAAVANGSSPARELIAVISEGLRTHSRQTTWQQSLCSSFEWTAALAGGFLLGKFHESPGALWAVFPIIAVLTAVFVSRRFALGFIGTGLGAATIVTGIAIRNVPVTMAVSMVLILVGICHAWNHVALNRASPIVFVGVGVGALLAVAPLTGSIYALGVLMSLLVVKISAHPFIALTAVPWFMIIGPGALVGTFNHSSFANAVVMTAMAAASVSFAATTVRQAAATC